MIYLIGVKHGLIHTCYIQCFQNNSNCMRKISSKKQKISINLVNASGTIHTVLQINFINTIRGELVVIINISIYPSAISDLIISRGAEVAARGKITSKKTKPNSEMLAPLGCKKIKQIRLRSKNCTL